MTISYLALKTELNTDPVFIGYSGNIAAGNDQGCADLLNLVRTSGTVVGASGSYMIFRDDVDPREVVKSIVPSDFTGLTQIQLSKLNLLFVVNPIDATTSGMRANFQNIFSGSATLLSGFLGSGLSQRYGSRGEILFGPGTSVSAADVGQALRHT